MDPSSPTAYEIPLPPAEKTAALRALVAGAEIAPEDVAAGWATDELLNRFLIARGEDVASAARMYTTTMRYRRDTGISAILDQYTNPRVMHLCFSGGFTGIDREGFPVYVERLGAADPVGIHDAVLRAAVETPPPPPAPGAPTLDPFVRWMAWNHEVQERLVRRWCARTGRSRGRITFIIDLSGVSLHHLSPTVISVIRSKAALEVAHYPEIVRRVFMVNTPQIVVPVWTAFKQVLDRQITDKFRILGSDFLPQLLRYVTPEVLPAFLGGALVDDAGDPECKRFIGGGGTVPLAYVTGVAADGRGLGEALFIPAGRKSAVTITIPSGARVEWRWGLQAHDITFSVDVCATPTSLPAGTLRVASSLRGVHTLAPEYTGPIPHFGDAAPLSHAPPVIETDSAPSQLPWAPAASRQTLSHGTGSWTVPASSESTLVRLTWDNGSSWLHGKTLSRRVDVVLAGADPASVPVEVDPAAAIADARVAHTDRFGLEGWPLPPGTVPGHFAPGRWPLPEGSESALGGASTGLAEPGLWQTER